MSEEQQAPERTLKLKAGGYVGVLMSGAEELASCPFCKSDKVENWASRPPDRDHDIWCVFCHECSCEGPEALTKAEAAKAWNTRSDLAPVAQPPIGENDAQVATVPNSALIQLLSAALLHPESAEGYIRQVIELLDDSAASLQPPSAQSEEIARETAQEIITDVVGRCGLTTIPDGLYHDVQMRLVGALTAAQSRGAELQREVDAEKVNGT